MARRGGLGTNLDALIPTSLTVAGKEVATQDEIDINLLYNFLDILKKIEEGELDQHEGSFQVGSILKAIYVDSALKKADKLDAANESDKVVPKKANVQISWKQFKTMK